MEKEILRKQKQLSKEGYIVVPNYYLREWVKMLGIGPAMLYLYLLTYCHKGKDIAWPTISTLSKTMDLTSKTITKYRQTLVKYGVIKKISKRKVSSGSHRRNIYRLLLFDMVKNTLSTGNISPYLEVKFTPDIGENLPTNNNNLNSTNTTTKGGDVAVDFIKIKEKGEEKIMAIKEKLRDLDFKVEFIEKILKNFSTKKIEEKLDLLMERKNIQNPAGWLMAALKNDYQGTEGEKYEEEPKERSSNFINTPEWTSHEKAMEAIRIIQDNLSTCISPLPSRKNAGARENLNQKLIRERRFKCPN